MHGDCLDQMTRIPCGSVDAVVADPPYGVTQCKWDSVIPLPQMWVELDRITKPNGAMVFTASQPFTTTLISSNIKNFKYTLVWEKNAAKGFLNANRMPLRAHEDICVFYRKPPTYNPQMVKGHPYIKKEHPSSNRQLYGKITKITSIHNVSGDRHPRSVIKIGKRNNETSHPTQKPIELMEWLIKTYTNPGETVLDFTMGSGSTGVAAIGTGRNFIGIERDDEFFQLATDRIK
ncbi:MAG: site-specific DNA-methyltransferase [Candidatus Brocadiales bacterium]|nr:site-specific DNA-methyltransferase [Candidatus Brocadiales bacterium]